MSTESSNYRRYFPMVLMTKYINKGTYHPFAPTLTSSHWNQMFAESVDLTVCVTMVFRGKNKDWIGPWMTFCELQTLTVGMSFYMFSLLFRYLDWKISWKVQIAEFYDSQIDLNSKWVWLIRLTNSLLAYDRILQERSLSKSNSFIKVWTCFIFQTFSKITELPLNPTLFQKSLPSSYLLSVQKILDISFSTTTKSLLLLMFGVLFNLLALVRTRHFCVRLQVILSQAT